MSGPYKSPLHKRKKTSTTKLIYTLYANPWKALATNTDGLELCETVKTSKLSSQGATSIKSWFQMDWKANCLSHGVAGSFRAQTSLLVSGSIKNQPKLYQTANLALYILYKLFTFQQSRFGACYNLQLQEGRISTYTEYREQRGSSNFHFPDIAAVLT